MLLKSIFSLFLLLFSYVNPDSKEYHREYDAQGILVAEGWMMDEKRVEFWKFYHKDGTITSKGHYTRDKKDGYWYYMNKDGVIVKEGHYVLGIAQKWWIFYDLATHEKRKLQYQDGRKNGFCLVYKDNKLEQVHKYENDKKVGSWDDVFSFKRDNPNVTF